MGNFQAYLAVLSLAMCLPAIADAQIPLAATKHQRLLVGTARQEFGMNAPIPLFAAQVHQESSWNCAAESPYAQGCAQFTPELSLIHI